MTVKKYPVCKSILVVEDDEEIRHTLQALLELEGFRVTSVSDGLQALRFLEATDRPCLVLLDLMMPVMDGWEFLDRIRAHHRTDIMAAPVIVTSAVSERLLHGPVPADDFIRKPYNLDAVLGIVQKYCQAEAHAA
jgi:CheY-like chemotaxis protein